MARFPDGSRTTHQSLRFGLQVNPSICDMATIGQQAEAAGFNVISVADHVGPKPTAPMVALAHLAARTSHIGLGTLVLNNDMRNPVQLAWEAATLHSLSGGRLELGLGAGHTPHEYAATGIAFEPPAVRKARLRESVDIMAALFRGEPVSYHGQHHQVSDARLELVSPPKILVGGNGSTLLRHAAANADIIGLQGLGRTKDDGHSHSVKFGIDHLEAQLAVIDEAASRAEHRPELNALVQVVDLTDERERAIKKLTADVDGLDPVDAAATPYLAIGTVGQVARQMLEARDRWGITYFSVRTLDLAPVIERVRHLEAGHRADPDR